MGRGVVVLPNSTTKTVGQSVLRRERWVGGWVGGRKGGKGGRVGVGKQVY